MGAVEKPRIDAVAVEVRHCRGLEEFRACSELERTVWGASDLHVPLPVYVVAHDSGGQVLGAFHSGRMVGFTLAMAGLREGRSYLHSHMTAVLPELQNLGIGRRLKLYQRQDALSRGIGLVEWTFDPLEVRNAYFNLERLGVIVRRFIPDCYGITMSPLHAGLPTDRLVAEWWLDSPRVLDRLAGRVPAGSKVAARIRLPSNIVELRERDRTAGARVQGELRGEFQDWLGRGYAITGFEIADEWASYLLERI